MDRHWFKPSSTLHGKSVFLWAAALVKAMCSRWAQLTKRFVCELQVKHFCFVSAYCSGDIWTQSVLHKSDYPVNRLVSEINSMTELKCLPTLASLAYLRDTDDGTLLIIPLSAISMACLISSFLYKETILDLGWFSRISSLRRYLLSNFLNLYMRQTNPSS